MRQDSDHFSHRVSRPNSTDWASTSSFNNTIPEGAATWKASGFVRLVLEVALALGLGPLVALGSEAGTIDPSTYYRGDMGGCSGPGETRFIATEVDRVMFRLTSVDNKYRIIRLKVETRCQASIQLSAEDTIELQRADGSTVTGFFALSKVDAALWDSLDFDTRQALAYPQVIKGRVGDATGPTGTPDVVYLFAFFPRAGVDTPPEAFVYKVKSLRQPVRIARPPATAARAGK